MIDTIEHDPEKGVLFEGGAYRCVPDLPLFEVAVDRVIASYDRATQDQKDYGLEWYDEANGIATEMYRSYKDKIKSVAHAAGLIAALSPNESWPKNIENAWMFLERDTSRSLPRSIDDARLIISGFDPYVVLFRQGVNFKVQNFYQNISRPDFKGPVTIDRHATGLVYDDPKIMKKKSHPTKSEYDYYAQVFTFAATDYGIHPHQMQAITWLEWKREFPTNDNSQLNLDINL